MPRWGQRPSTATGSPPGRAVDDERPAEQLDAERRVAELDLPRRPDARRARTGSRAAVIGPPWRCGRGLCGAPVVPRVAMASTTRVTANGRPLSSSTGMPVPPSAWIRSWNACSAPMPHAAGSSSPGRQRATITRARATKPRPPMIWSENSPTMPADSTAPPSPPRAPAAIDAIVRTRSTSTPLARAAAEPSPAARSSRPARVRVSTRLITRRASGNSHTTSGWRNSTGPSTGIRSRPGMSTERNGSNAGRSV